LFIRLGIAFRIEAGGLDKANLPVKTRYLFLRPSAVACEGGFSVSLEEVRRVDLRGFACGGSRQAANAGC
jgi:hypothetical protein